MAITREREKGVPVLVLDAGNALFKLPADVGDPSQAERAKFLLEQMDALGTAAMGVGARDLSLGLGFLRKQAAGKGLKLLSANLVSLQGKRIFPASAVFTAGELKVGVVGVSPEIMLQEAMGQPALPAVVAEARRLRQKDKVDVVVVLAPVPQSAARQLAQQGEGVDFVIHSNEGQAPGMASRDGMATLLPTGDRGRQLARLELSVDGPGAFVDLASAGRDQDRLKLLEANLGRAKERLAATKDEPSRRALEESIARLEAQRKSLLKSLKGGATAVARTHRLSYTSLGAEVPSDPAVQKQVERIKPPGSGHAH